MLVCLAGVAVMCCRSAYACMLGRCGCEVLQRCVCLYAWPVSELLTVYINLNNTVIKLKKNKNFII